MKPRLWRAILPATAVAFAASRLPAVDPPHWTSATDVIDCTSQCHTLHSAPGGQLTAAAGNVNLCLSCHNPSGVASGRPIANSNKATPDLGGTSHAFDVSATNATYGAAAPQNTEMALRVMNGNIVCSTCHNQHSATSALGGTPRISSAEMITALGSTGTVTSGGTYTGAAGFWYLVEVQSATTFRWSKDNGLSWMASNLAMSRGTARPLDNGVTVLFSAAGTFTTGERWQLSASWPFLRARLDTGTNAAADKFCRDCHRDWTMDHTAVETWTGTKKGHPVGIALDANGRGYDRTVPLDGNGNPLTGGADQDGNPTNDFELDAGRLQCVTCHGAHYADSNTLTVDQP